MPSLKEEGYQSDSSQITVIRWRDKSTDKVTAIQVCYIMDRTLIYFLTSDKESQTLPINTTTSVCYIGKFDCKSWGYLLSIAESINTY